MEQDNRFGYKVEKGTIEFGGKTINKDKLYLIDFSKLNSVNDLVLILSAMSIAFPGDHPHIEVLKPFLNTDNPMDIPNRTPQPQRSDLTMPKLKTIR
jgi:hypothetical protein